MPHTDGGGWSLVGPAVFKTVVGREERPGCVRFAHASAICHDLREPVRAGSRLRWAAAAATAVSRQQRQPGGAEAWSLSASDGVWTPVCVCQSETAPPDRRPIPSRSKGRSCESDWLSRQFSLVLSRSRRQVATAGPRRSSPRRRSSPERPPSRSRLPPLGTFQYEAPEGLPIWPMRRSSRQARQGLEVVGRDDPDRRHLRRGARRNDDRAGKRWLAVRDHRREHPESPTTLLNVSRNGTRASSPSPDGRRHHHRLRDRQARVACGPALSVDSPGLPRRPRERASALRRGR